MTDYGRLHLISFCSLFYLAVHELLKKGQSLPSHLQMIEWLYVVLFVKATKQLDFLNSMFIKVSSWVTYCKTCFEPFNAAGEFVIEIAKLKSQYWNTVQELR